MKRDLLVAALLFLLKGGNNPARKAELIRRLEELPAFVKEP